MKKTLQIVLLLLCIAQESKSQGLISNNNYYTSGYPMNANTAIFSSQLPGMPLLVTDGAYNTFSLNVSVTFEAGSGVGIYNNKLYFSGIDSTNESELWQTDGTNSGTTMVKNINSGTASSSPLKMAVFNSELYFYAKTQVNGYELWKTNGTEAGTVMVRDISPGAPGSLNPDIRYYIYNNELYFTPLLDDGVELWKTNGTESGTVLVKDINPGSNSSTPIFCKVFDNELFFTADDGAHGRELWKTNGTETGTSLVKDIFPGVTSSGIGGIVLFNGKILFNATAETGNPEMYSSDGTTAGTGILKEVNPGAIGSDPDITGGITINSKFYFTAFSAATGREIFLTDGTDAGTKVFYDINPGPTGSEPRFWLDRRYTENISNPNASGENERLFNGEIFFQAVGGDSWDQFWITDGTVANTRDLMYGYTCCIFGGGSAVPGNYMYTQSGVYFRGNHQLSDYELFGATNSGISFYRNINPTNEGSYPSFGLFVVNCRLFFTGSNDDDDYGYEPLFIDLFTVDGCALSLPLQLLNFSAVATQTGVSLNWLTVNEDNSEKFELQRCTDGNNFQNIETVRASGNSNAKKEYSYFDKEAYQQGSANLYYRLKIVDFNGRYTYSPVVLLKLNMSFLRRLEVSPNPARQFVRLNYDALNSTNAEIRLINSTGQVVYKISTHFLKGKNQLLINTEKLSTGFYYLQLNLNGQVSEKAQFEKQR